MGERVEILGGAWRCKARRVGARLDTLRGGIPAEVGRVMARRGVARQGGVWRGSARRGAANTRHLTGCRSLRGVARLWCGVEGCGSAGLGKHTASQGVQKFVARRGFARRGLSGQGWARHGSANTQHPTGC